MNTNLEHAEEAEQDHTRALYALVAAVKLLLKGESGEVLQPCITLRPYVADVDAAVDAWEEAIKKLKHDGAVAH